MGSIQYDNLIEKKKNQSQKSCIQHIYMGVLLFTTITSPNPCYVIYRYYSMQRQYLGTQQYQSNQTQLVLSLKKKIFTTDLIYTPALILGLVIVVDLFQSSPGSMKNLSENNRAGQSCTPSVPWQHTCTVCTYFETLVS